MRICLTSTFFPPEDTGGIPRQRHILAKALNQKGHEVHVIIQGKLPDTIIRDHFIIHVVPILTPPLTFSKKCPSLDYLLTHSLGIQEQIRNLNRECPLDILDAPLWGLEGFIPIYADEIPVVLWLQTSRAQLVALDKRQPKEDDLGIMVLEKESLVRARGIIADSQTVLDDLENLYTIEGLRKRSRVIPLGIPDLPVALRAKEREGNAVEILIVGRLEKRKGTQYLFDIMPRLLKIDNRLRVRFIGSDNSQWDGFFDQFKLAYPDYFQKRWPKLRDRVLFEGPVTEERLNEAYRQADIMLVPSLYESFGLIYLEAMRAGLPVVTFAVGATGEIFPHGKEDGALIIPSGNEATLLTAIQDLISNPMRRKELGMQGRERFLESYLDTRMAEETAAYYREILRTRPTAKKTKPRRIFQVMEALTVGDAVSRIALENAELLQKMGAGGTILSLHAHPQVADKVRPVRNFDPQANAALIFHYWNYSYLEEFIRRFRGPKAIHFHNITPPKYFPPGSPAYEATSKGYEQLPRIVNLFDLIIGDSSFNLEVCRHYLSDPKPAIVIPPVIEKDEILSRPYDARFLEQLQEQEGTKFLFVGRIARNKRQDRLIEVFDAYYRRINRRAWLYLVGSDEGDPRYRTELEALAQQLPSKDRIIFTGKVTDEALYSYYRAADVFICASEHEGFCVPIVEAMALDIPVAAFAAAAVPETMAGSGLLIHEWDVSSIADLINQVMNDSALREKILVSQRKNLSRLTATVVSERLAVVVGFLQFGETDYNIIFIDPDINGSIM